MGINDIWLTVHAGPECCHRGIDEEEEANAAAHQAIIQLNVSEWRQVPFKGFKVKYWNFLQTRIHPEFFALKKICEISKCI
jgi:hypothetical protein